MSIEMKAALQTLKFVGIIAAASAGLIFLSVIFSPELVTWLMILSLIGCGIWMVYSVNLSNLKYKEKDQRTE